MKTNNGLRYALRDGFVGLFRHPLVLVASITTMMLMLFMSSAFFTFSANAQHLVEVAGKQPPIEIMFRPGVSAKVAEQVDDSLEGRGDVIFHQLYSPEKNFEQFKNNMDRQELYEDFDYTQRIPYTIQVRLNDPAQGPDFLKEMELNPYIREVYMESELMSFLNNMEHKVRLISIITFVVLLVITVFIISNMTRIAALARSYEINIMRYIGATNAYIRIPFIVQGMAVGLFGAIISGGLFWFLYNALYNRFSGGIISDTDFTLLAPARILPLVLLGSLAIGLIVGGVTSALSVRKHTKV